MSMTINVVRNLSGVIRRYSRRANFNVVKLNEITEIEEIYEEKLANKYALNIGYSEEIIDITLNSSDKIEQNDTRNVSNKLEKTMNTYYVICK
jgi:hypothetical protein